MSTKNLSVLFKPKTLLYHFMNSMRNSYPLKPLSQPTPNLKKIFLLLLIPQTGTIPQPPIGGHQGPTHIGVPTTHTLQVTQAGVHLQPSLPILLWLPTQELHPAPTALYPIHTRGSAKYVAFRVILQNDVHLSSLYQSTPPLQVLHYHLPLPHLGSHGLILLQIPPPKIHLGY